VGFTVLQEGLRFWEKSGLDGPIWLVGKELGAELERAVIRELAGLLAEVTEGAAVSGTGVWAAAASRATGAAAMPN
jgi:hypothetical protein